MKPKIYDQTALDIIGRSSILGAEDFAVVERMRGELKEVFMNAQVFRTRTEMEVSVLDDIHYPTPDSKYWQAVREQKVQFHELVMLSYEYRKNLIEIKQMEAIMEEDELKRELVNIEIERATFIARNQERVAKDRIRELAAWEEIKERLRPDMACSETDVNDHQLLSYTKRWVRQFFAMGENGSPSERANLHGQLLSGLKQCKERGIVEQALESLNSKGRQVISNFYQQKYEEIL